MNELYLVMAWKKNCKLAQVIYFSFEGAMKGVNIFLQKEDVLKCDIYKKTDEIQTIAEFQLYKTINTERL